MHLFVDELVDELEVLDDAVDAGKLAELEVVLELGIEPSSA